MPRPTRLHIALVVVGATLAIMVLAVLQVALPILLGLWGLATILVVDLLIALFFHRRRMVHERSLRNRVHDSGPRGEAAHRPSSFRPRDASDREMAMSAVAVAVLFCVCVVGQTVQGAALTQSLNLPLYVAGAAITLVGLALIDVTFWQYAPMSASYWNPGLDDTTDDH